MIPGDTKNQLILNIVQVYLIYYSLFICYEFNKSPETDQKWSLIFF